MAGSAPLWAQRRLWTTALGVLAAAFWIVALGVGLRGWLTLGPQPGIVGHATEFGQQAAPYMVTAAILTMTTAVLGVGTALVRHLVDGRTTVGSASAGDGPHTVSGRSSPVVTRSERDADAAGSATSSADADADTDADATTEASRSS